MQDEIQREQTVQTWREEVLSRSSVSIFVSTGIYFFLKNCIKIIEFAIQKWKNKGRFPH